MVFGVVLIGKICVIVLASASFSTALFRIRCMEHYLRIVNLSIPIALPDNEQHFNLWIMYFT